MKNKQTALEYFTEQEQQHAVKLSIALEKASTLPTPCSFNSRDITTHTFCKGYMKQIKQAFEYQLSDTCENKSCARDVIKFFRNQLTDDLMHNRYGGGSTSAHSNAIDDTIRSIISDWLRPFCNIMNPDKYSDKD